MSRSRRCRRRLPRTLSILLCALHATGKHDEVIKAASGPYSFYFPDVKEALARGYAEEGYAGAWRRAADIEVSRHAEEPGIAYWAASDYMFAGDAARALDWLEKAADARDPNAPYIACDPTFDPLRSEPRFQALLKKFDTN